MSKKLSPAEVTAEIARLRKVNWMFRRLDKVLGPEITDAKRLEIFKAVRNIAETVMQRTINDLMNVG